MAQQRSIKQCTAADINSLRNQLVTLVQLQQEHQRQRAGLEPKDQEADRARSPRPLLLWSRSHGEN